MQGSVSRQADGGAHRHVNLEADDIEHVCIAWRCGAYETTPPCGSLDFGARYLYRAR